MIFSYVLPLVNFINILQANFFVRKCFAQLFSSYVLGLKFLALTYWGKSLVLNVDEIDTILDYLANSLYDI